jgi:hypothetical protein
LIAQGRDDPFTPFARGFLNEPGQIGDALRGGKSSDRAYRLLPIRGVDPRTNRMRDDQSREKNQ